MFTTKKKRAQQELQNMLQEAREQIMSQLVSEPEQTEDKTLSPIAAKEELETIVKAYHHNPTVFKPGDMVMWKPGMQDAQEPARGEAIMVLETFAPVRNTDNPSSNRHMEPVDMRAIVWYAKGGTPEFGVFSFNSKRFELVPQK